jgi:hypothetical protein
MRMVRKVPVNAVLIQTIQFANATAGDCLGRLANASGENITG